MNRIDNLADDITLTLDEHAETGLYADQRCGFTMGIPGHPTLKERQPTPELPAPKEPTFESLVVLADLPVTLRFRLSSLPEIPSATAFAAGFARVFSLNRCRPSFATPIHEAQPDQCQRFGVQAAASCRYPLREPDEQGADSEEVLVLVRSGQVLTITKRFDAQRTPWIAWSLFNSATSAALFWGETVTPGPAPVLWPRSHYLLPGVAGVLRQELAGVAEHLRSVLVLLPDKRQTLTARAERLVLGTEPPAAPVSSQERSMYLYSLTRGALADAQELALQAAVAEVRTAHDLRGFGILVLHALGQHRATFAAAPPEPPPPSPVDLYAC